MSDISTNEIEIDSTSSNGKNGLADSLLIGMAWAMAAFTLGLAVTMVLMMDGSMVPIDALIDWFAA